MNEKTQNNDNSGAYGVSRLLGDTAQIIGELKTARYLWSAMYFSVTAICGCALFGAATGAFGGWELAMLDAVKLAGVAVFGYVLCLPSLYVFTCLSGTTLSFGRIAAFGLSSLAIMGCVLAALSPILWLFAVSTASAKFLVVFAIVLAAVAFYMATRPFKYAVSEGVASSPVGSYAWFAVFVAVVLQSLTLVRPMLSRPSDFAKTSGKCLFIQHFVETMQQVEG